jgi:site-specific recombinase XerC
MLKMMKRGNWYHVKGKNSVGTLIPRHSSQCSNEDTAFEYLKSIDRAAEWPPKPPAPVEEKRDVPLPVALEKYLKHIRPKTKEVTRALYKREIESCMLRFLAELTDPVSKKPRPVTNVGQLERDHLVDMQDHWLNTVKVTTTLGHRRVSNAFVAYLVESGWLPKNPWKNVPKPASEHIATLPLDEDDTHANWNRVRAGIVPFLKGELLMKNGKPFLRPSNPLWQNPESFLAFLELMYETGLRRSDAILFDPRKLTATDQGNFAYTTDQQKSRHNRPKKVTVFLQPWLAEKLRALPVLDPVLRLPFYTARCASATNYVAKYVADPLTALGDALGIPGLRCHRFRDSFAVNFLNAGGSLEDLKVLLGHQKVAITELYYNPWVDSRRKAVEKRLNRARAQQDPATKLTVVPAA